MKPHRTDGVSLSFGLIFLAVALWWALAQVVTVHLPALGWLVAGGLILLGVIGLLSAIRSGRQSPAPAAVPAPAAGPLTNDDLPPQLHAEIVRELLEPTQRLPLEPVTAPPAHRSDPAPARPEAGWPDHASGMRPDATPEQDTARIEPQRPRTEPDGHGQ